MLVDKQNFAQIVRQYYCGGVLLQLLLMGYIIIRQERRVFTNFFNSGDSHRGEKVRKLSEPAAENGWPTFIEGS